MSVAPLQGLLVTGLILVELAQRGRRISLAEAADLEAAGIGLMAYGGLGPGEALRGSDVSQTCPKRMKRNPISRIPLRRAKPTIGVEAMTPVAA